MKAFSKFVLLFFILFIIACDKDDSDLTPIPSPEVPQGILNLPETPFNYSNIVVPYTWNDFETQITDNQPASNPISDHGATLGRVLFYDKKLSKNETTSCASCHKQIFAFADNQAQSIGFQGESTRRNSMTLVQSRYYRPGTFFWDTRAQDLESQTLLPIEDHIEMGMTLEELIPRLEATSYYPALFEAAFGEAAITPDRIAESLAQFIRSIISFESRFDEARTAGTNPFLLDHLTGQESFGKLLFFDGNRAACIRCHTTDLFIAEQPRNNGLELDYLDEGLAEHTGLSEDVGKFKVATLKNIEFTAPYMHDGRFKTLEEVVDHYSEGIQAHPNLDPLLRDKDDPSKAKKLNFTASEKEALVAFLKTLSDQKIRTAEKYSDPFN